MAGQGYTWDYLRHGKTLSCNKLISTKQNGILSQKSHRLDYGQVFVEPMPFDILPYRNQAAFLW